MRINKEQLDVLINNGIINDTKHKDYPLTILNYSKIAQFEKNWNPLSLQCRGLIIDEDYNTVAIPFRKFFNMEEINKEEIPNESYEIYKKMDGSLGILFHYADKWHMATRGSFISEQSVRGREILENRYAHLIPQLNPEITYLFEIIYKDNRIVIDYGDTEDLILLGAVNKNNGEELSIDDINLPFTKVEKINITSFQELKNRNLKNEEGYVIKFIPSNYRMKIKFEDYVYLHGIVTEFSNKKVWEILRNGLDLKTVLEIVPDEFFDKAKLVYDEIKNQFDTIKNKSISVAEEGKKFTNRKDLALWLLKEHKDIMPFVFGIIDNKNVDDTIWKSIKPEFEKI
jgi:RNA ligase